MVSRCINVMQAQNESSLLANLQKSGNKFHIVGKQFVVHAVWRSGSTKSLYLCSDDIYAATYKPSKFPCVSRRFVSPFCQRSWSALLQPWAPSMWIAQGCFSLTVWHATLPLWDRQSYRHLDNKPWTDSGRPVR
jgi:hypothetical protein